MRDLQVDLVIAVSSVNLSTELGLFPLIIPSIFSANVVGLVLLPSNGAPQQSPTRTPKRVALKRLDNKESFAVMMLLLLLLNVLDFVVVVVSI